MSLTRKQTLLVYFLTQSGVSTEKIVEICLMMNTLEDEILDLIVYVNDNHPSADDIYRKAVELSRDGGALEGLMQDAVRSAMDDILGWVCTYLEASLEEEDINAGQSPLSKLAAYTEYLKSCECAFAHLFRERSQEFIDRVEYSYDKLSEPHRCNVDLYVTEVVQETPAPLLADYFPRGFFYEDLPLAKRVFANKVAKGFMEVLGEFQTGENIMYWEKDFKWDSLNGEFLLGSSEGETVKI